MSWKAGTMKAEVGAGARALGRPATARRGRAILLALAAGLAAAGLAACGGKSSETTSTAATTTATTTAAASPPLHQHQLGKAAYASTMRRLGRSLASSVESMYPIDDNGNGSANNEALAKVERAKSGVETVRTSLREIIAPADVRADHAQLVQAVGALEGELGDLVVVLGHPLKKPLGQYFRFAAIGRVTTAVADIRKKGYAIG